MNLQLRPLLMLVLVTLVMPWDNAQGTLTDNLGAAKDNTLYEDLTGSLSNGAGPGFFAGRTGLNSIQRGLISFDVAATIPAGATITDATLTLNVSMSASATSESIGLHAVSADWGEAGSVATGGMGGGGAGGLADIGDATWLHRFTPTDLWTSPGGDFSPLASATQLVGTFGFFSWTSTPQMISDLQGWLDDPATNFGWLLQGNEISSFTSKRFDTRENTIVANRPLLTIDYVFDADFDGDDDVDRDDLTKWEGDFGLTNGSDADGDGDSDGADFLVWQQQFGSGVPPIAASKTVPEPTTLALLVGLSSAMLVRRGQLAIERPS